MAKGNKSEIVTFKADAALLQAMKGVPNRSEFIRSAVLAALENVCPLCAGTGILTPSQREHWKAFSSNHSVEVCQECNEAHLICGREPGAVDSEGETP